MNNYKKTTGVLPVADSYCFFAFLLRPFFRPFFGLLFEATGSGSHFIICLWNSCSSFSQIAEQTFQNRKMKSGATRIKIHHPKPGLPFACSRTMKATPIHRVINPSTFLLNSLLTHTPLRRTRMKRARKELRKCNYMLSLGRCQLFSTQTKGSTFCGKLAAGSLNIVAESISL